MGAENTTLLRLDEIVVRIRVVERHAERLFLEKRIPGFIHLYTSTHRGHGHMPAKGPTAGA